MGEKSVNTVDSLSIIIPVYNSAATLDTLVSRLTDALEDIGIPYEIILVNDGSRDASWERIVALSQMYKRLRGINLMRNYGQHNALLCGIRTARSEIIVTMDDDLQHPPEEIPHLLDKLAEGYDVVYGTPRTLPHSLWRNVLSKYTKWAVASAMGIHGIRDINAFRAFRTDLRKAFDNYQSPNVLLDVLLSWGTTRFVAIKVNQAPRQMGRSSYTFAKLFNQAMLVLTGYSTTPLRLASMIGFAVMFFSILLVVYVVAQSFLVGALPGFPFLASIIALFSGVQLFALGIIGEYLARIFNRSMDRPTYVISRRVEQVIEFAEEMEAVND